MPSVRVDAVRKMLTSAAGQDLIRLFQANAQMAWATAIDEIRSGAESMPPEVIEAKFYEAVLKNLEYIIATPDEPSEPLIQFILPT